MTGSGQNWNWQHVAIGGGLWGLAALLRVPEWRTLVALLIVGIWHEISDGDFKKVNQGPWNGIVDVYSFFVVPVVSMIWGL